MSTKPQTQKKQGRSAIEDVVAREYTIHLHKRVRSV
jgi:large subunit ribosomal protein L31e